MQLRHVYMWTKHGWKAVSAKEAALLHPGGTVSAASGLFMCGLCGQYLTFTCGKYQVRHFRHSSQEADKECEDRSKSQDSVDGAFQKDSLSLPMRINILSGDRFELELGFVLPKKITSDSRICFADREYLLSRLNEGSITYLSAGDIPRAIYEIAIVPDNKALSELWPASVEGISESGTLFDGVTRKKLPQDADVLMNHKYYLLTKQYVTQCKDISVNEVCSSSGWLVYELSALSFSINAAHFFKTYNCRLSENTASIVPLWPAYVERPCQLIYNIGDAKPTVFYLIGDAYLKIFPSGRILGQENIYSVVCGERTQILAAGRTKILQYMYIWKDKNSLSESTPLPGINITDPEITPEFDGYALVLKGDEVIWRYDLKAGRTTRIDAITTGCRLEIYQGLDLVRCIEYKHNSLANSTKDKTLLHALENCGGEIISVPHSLGVLSARMNDCPQSKKWLVQHIREGRMSQRAYKTLLHNFS